MTFLSPSYTDTGRTAGTLPRRGRRERSGRRAPCVPRGRSRAARPASSLSSGFQLGRRVSAAVRRPGPASPPSTPGASGAAAKTMFAFQKRSDWRLGEAPAERTARTQWAGDGAGGATDLVPAEPRLRQSSLEQENLGSRLQPGARPGARGLRGPPASVVSAAGHTWGQSPSALHRPARPLQSSPPQAPEATFLGPPVLPSETLCPAVPTGSCARDRRASRPPYRSGRRRRQATV